MTGNTLIKTLYKSLFKLAQKYDKNIPAKAILYRLPPSSSSADSVFRSAAQIHFNAVMDKVLGRQRLFFHPTRMDQSMKAIVQKEFRNTKSKISLNSRLDVGFSLLRQLTSLWVMFEQEVQYRMAVDNLLMAHRANTSPRSTSTALDTDSDASGGIDSRSTTSGKKSSSTKKKKTPAANSSKLDVTTAPATIQDGVIIAAHPMVHGDMHRSLVLIVEHTAEYTYGVILNKAEGPVSPARTVRGGVSGLRVDGFYDAFGENPLFFGGNVRRLSHLHSSAACAGMPISNSKTTTPLFMHGSIEKAISFVQNQEHQNEREDAARQFYFFAGACFWEPGQLQTQVQEGTWLPVLAPVDTVLQMSLLDTAKFVTDATSSSTPGATVAGEGGGSEGVGVTGEGSEVVTESTERDRDSISTGETDTLKSSATSDAYAAGDVEEDEREKQNRVWTAVVHSASRNCAQLARLPFSLHSAAVEPLAWTGDDHSSY